MHKNYKIIGGVFVGYLTLNAVMWYNPRKYEKKFDARFAECLKGKRVLRIGHRGGSRGHTENTMEAFEEGAEKCDMLEMDVCETKDGVLVVHHDTHLRRTCGVDRSIGDCNFNELPSFLPQIPLHFANGAIHCSAGERIPTFESVLLRFPHKLLTV